jgi:sterol desaturase/sphingolipid hydroxylase (fatty acid hydroxylase superfamily)
MVAAILASGITFLYVTLVGWVIHWTLHQRWSGPLYRAHMNHHLTQYPPSKLLSDTYRSSGLDNGLFFFTPAAVLAFALYFGAYVVGGSSPWLLALIGLECLTLGVMNEWLHTQYHLRVSRLDRYPWFQSFQRWHFTHHTNMRKNFGVIWLGWDRLFRTFRDR